ncbi:asparagine synthase (glutamine-hydrolyzing) [archaeon]|nr:asparagine synthase (glutamine-hydrolyzing) [archaeon]
MCGICGFNWENEELLKEMLVSTKHRGPDDQGTYIEKNMSLGHNRLSIIDLSENGKNPLWNENKTICVLHNGEIYNYKEIKKELIEKKHRFRSKTDSEVILHGYEEFGEEILKKLNGMFAFAIYNRMNKRIFVARDRLGIKPLYYHYNKKENKLIFASEIKAILNYKELKKEPNYEAITEYLTFQNILDEKTFFKGINILPPGNYLTLKNNNLEKVEYWKPEFRYKKRSYMETLNEFREILKRSIKRHLISDVPVGSYLSGGFDSGTATTMASKIYPNKFNTFTCTFDVKGEYDETPCARAVASQIGANNFEIELKKEDFVKNIEKMIYHLDEPKVGIPIISQYPLSKLASKHVKVTLTGHGGDELFAGYPVFQAKLFAQKSKTVKAFLKILKNKKRLNIAYYLFMPKIYPEIKNGIFIAFPEKEKIKALTKEFLHKTKEYSPEKEVKKVLKNYENLTEIEKLQLLYMKTYLPSLFIAQDKMEMAHSTEARVPLCDNELVDFSLSIPIEQKLKNNELKGIIKNSMKGIIPDILYSQEKRGFPTPLGNWLKQGLDKYFEEVLLSEKAIKRNIYKKKYVKKLLKKTDFWSVNKLWCLLNIELWHRIFIDPS